MDKGSNIIKYIFIVFVIGLICFTAYLLVKNKRESLTQAELDQTSKKSNIQTDLRLAVAGFDTINPILSRNRNVQELSRLMYEPLINLDSSYKKEYCLATEVVKTEPGVYIVKVRDDVTWSDGNKFNIYDVIFTIDLVKNGVSSIYSENMKDIVEIEQIDDYTMKLVLSYDVPFFEYNLTFPILSKAYYENEDFVNTEKNLMPVSTGKFKVAEIINQNEIKLVRNDSYWNQNKLPMVKEIIIKKYETIGEVYNAFKSGDIDIYTVKAKNVEDYIGTIGYIKYEYKARDYDFLVLNNANEVLANQAVRRALSLVVDRETLTASVLGAGYTPSNFSLDMGNFLYTRDLNFPANTEEAHQILLQDGWEYKNNSWQKNVDGKMQRLNFNLSVDSSNESRVRVVEALREQFANFGVHLNIQYLSRDGYVNAINNRNFDIILSGVTMGFSPSVDTFFADGNLANYYNEEIRNILEETKNTNDENVLYEKYSRIYDIYEAEAPYIGLYRNTESIILNQGLVGNIVPNTFNIFYNIEKWYRQ